MRSCALRCKTRFAASIASCGTTIVFVTHDVDEALRLADRVVVVAGGAVAQADTPARLLAAPANDIVRSLVGIDAESRRFADARPLLEREPR